MKLKTRAVFYVTIRHKHTVQTHAHAGKRSCALRRDLTRVRMCVRVRVFSLQPCCRRGARSWVASSCCVTRRTGRTNRRERSPCSPAWAAWSPASHTGQWGVSETSPVALIRTANPYSSVSSRLLFYCLTNETRLFPGVIISPTQKKRVKGGVSRAKKTVAHKISAAVNWY